MVRKLSLHPENLKTEDKRSRAGRLRGERSLRDAYTAFGPALPLVENPIPRRYLPLMPLPFLLSFPKGICRSKPCRKQIPFGTDNQKNPTPKNLSS